MKTFTDFMLFFSKDSNRGKGYKPARINKIFTFLIITTFLLFTVPVKAIDSPFNFKFEVNKINYQNSFIPSSPHGFITVSFTPGQEGKYLSVLAENNSENVSGFIVENMFLPPIGEADSVTEFSTVFLLSQVSISLKLPIKLTLTAYITDFPDYFPFQEDSIAEITTVDVREIIYNANGVEVMPIPVSNVPVTEEIQPKGDRITTLIRRRNMDNIDLDSAGHPPTATYAGDYGASAPAATANSIFWLQNAYTDVVKHFYTIRQTLEQLSERMGRKPNGGVTDRGMIAGKLAFSERFLVAINIKFQCEGIEQNIAGRVFIAKNLKKEGEKPSLDFLRQMLEEGEDVEINYTWIDPNTGTFGTVGNSVVVSGLIEFASKHKKITIKHDTNQRCPGGTKEEVHKVTTDSSGWLRFGPSYEYYVTCIVAESPGFPSQFNQGTAVYVNEFLTSSGAPGTSTTSATDFIEVAVNRNIPDLQKYRVTIYNSSSEQVATTTLDQFTAGESADDFTLYSYTFTGDALPEQYGGIGLTFSGSPVPGSFISWGGTITAVNGDCTGLTSNDLNITSIAGHSYALAGTGIAYDDFQWVSDPNPSPGMLNPSQTVPVAEIAITTPLKYKLAQNYPNPFNPVTTISYSLPSQGFTSLKVYDILGGEVVTLVNEVRDAGNYKINFDASSLTSGVYYYTITSGGFTDTKKFLLIK